MRTKNVVRGPGDLGSLKWEAGKRRALRNHRLGISAHLMGTNHPTVPSLIRVLVEFVPALSFIAPPFTSKVSRTIFLRGFNEIASSLLGGLHKPMTISPVFRIDHEVKYIYKTRGEQEPVILKEDKVYGFTVSIFKQVDLRKLIETFEPGSKVKVFNSEVIIKNCRIESRSLDTLGLDSKYVKFNFKVPALLSFPKKWAMGRGPVRHALFPIPSFIVHSLAQHWNAYAPEELAIQDLRTLAAYSNFALVEVDYSLRPLTVIYDERARPRGFVGWVIYEHRRLNEKLSRSLSKLLDYANYSGVGRSRSIGFGLVEVTGFDKVRTA